MILAIDPGCTESGYVVVFPHFASSKADLIACGVLPNRDMRLRIDEFFRSVAAPLRPRIAIEHFQNMGMIVGREVFESVHWAGRFYERCEDGWNTTPQLVYRTKVKLHLCGNPRARDANIRQALIDRFGAPGTKKAPGGTYAVKSHAWSALAVATYAIDNPEEPR